MPNHEKTTLLSTNPISYETDEKKLTNLHTEIKQIVEPAIQNSRTSFIYNFGKNFSIIATGSVGVATLASYLAGKKLQEKADEICPGFDFKSFCDSFDQALDCSTPVIKDWCQGQDCLDFSKATLIVGGAMLGAMFIGGAVIACKYIPKLCQKEIEQKTHLPSSIQQEADELGVVVDPAHSIQSLARVEDALVSERQHESFLEKNFGKNSLYLRLFGKNTTASDSVSRPTLKS